MNTNLSVLSKLSNKAVSSSASAIPPEVLTPPVDAVTTALVPVNVVINTDCIQAMKAMPDLSVDMTLTDIPYGEIRPIGSIEREKAPGHLRKQDKEEAGEVTFDIDEFLEQVSRVTRGGIYIFCGIEQLVDVFRYFKSRHKDFMVRQCAWRKTNPSTMAGEHMWLSSFENCIFAKRRRTKFHARCKSSVWDFPTGRGKVHPTEKPLALFKYLIESCSDVGDIVFDPCIGSGTTAVAALELGRNYLGYELHKEYYDICMERIRLLKKEA